MFKIVYHRLLSEKTKERSEQLIITVSIISFLVHLALIFLHDFEVVVLEGRSDLLRDPIAAIYTPFSFILLYEVYLLVYYLPKSISNYISKQYEIITLIVLRRIFKDLSALELNTDWFKDREDLQFTYDILTTLLLFLLIYFFHRLNQTEAEVSSNQEEMAPALVRFIKIKKTIAVALMPILIILACYSFGDWFYQSFFSIDEVVDSVQDVNEIFFNEFFIVLILTDVLLLLFSLFYTKRFNKIIRNSGFVISTILIRISFGTEGPVNNVLVVVAVLFGVLILWIDREYEKRKMFSHL